MVYLRGGTVVHQPSFLEEVLALPVRIYHMIVFFIMTLIDPKAAKKGPGGSGAAKGGFGAARRAGGSSGRMGGMGTVKGAPAGGFSRRQHPAFDFN